MTDDGPEERDGVEAKAVVLEQLASALHVIRVHDPARITTLGGECAVSVAPFAELARRYGDDLAIVWIDSHPCLPPPQRRLAACT
ncbi:arginase family protein [Nonomuraea sp. NPDC050680]|uniref:arginase family protein n=1 Tax=Nonomuraea sp. NPDC050680 TaxID=3154630 RepID=UPI0033E4F224